jgi:hypothetical protein
MRDQVWYVATLIALMCAVRFGLAAYGYVDPISLMEQLGAPYSDNQQAPYIVRVWAIRDMALALLVVLATRNTIRPLLLACIAIDVTDVLSAHLAGESGLFNSEQTWSLKITAFAALVPEAIALALIMRRKPAVRGDA